MKTKLTSILILSFGLFIAAFTFDKKDISGKVTNSSGSPLQGVSVLIKGTTNGTITNRDGFYSIKDIEKGATLVFSFPGFETQEKITSDERTIDVILMETDMKLDEIMLVSDRVEKDYSAEEVESAKISYRESTLKRKKHRALKGLLGKTRGVSVSSIVEYEEEYSIDDVSDGVEFDDKGSENTERSGQLTAGEIHDFSKWEMWGDISANQLKEYTQTWNVKPNNRYCVQVSTESGKPAINAEVKLMQKDSSLWITRTDNTGKAELWWDEKDKKSSKNLIILVTYQGESYKIKRPTQFHEGINMLEIKAKCEIPNDADIVFVVDATGSMGDEIAFLKAEMTDVITRIKKEHQDISVKLGSVFYRDHGDSYLVKSSDLDTDISKTEKFIAQQNAGGGGDYPEAVEEGLETAINTMSWSENARAKIIFLVLDAPPHSTPEITSKITALIKKAAQKGIKIVPVAASGVDKSTEFLMRSMALATNGTYVFLTDDSGIGGSHIKPTTDEYKVELLNDLLVRLVKQYLITPDCDNNLPQEITQNKDTLYITENIFPPDSTKIENTDTTGTTANIEPVKKETLKYYPNPTQDIVNIVLLGEVKQMFLADISGKILQRFDTENQTRFVMSIGRFPSGIYFIQYLSGENWKTGKVILRH